MQRKGLEPSIPDFDWPSHLLEVFYDVGPSLEGGMGAVPLTHSEIDAWKRNSGVELTAWEAKALRRLSREYVAEACRAKGRTAFPPWSPDEVAVEKKKQVAADLMAAMRQVAAGDS